MKARLALLFLSLHACGCRGTLPSRNGTPEQGLSAIIIGSRITLPTGETRSGRIFINFEEEGGSGASIYRLVAYPEPSLYQVEPGTYRLALSRSLLGSYLPDLKIEIDGASYRIPFPKSLSRKNPVILKSAKIAIVGVLQATLGRARLGQQPPLELTLDDSIETRRKLISDLIGGLLDPATPPEQKSNAVSWTRALDQSLIELSLEKQKAAPIYKPEPETWKTLP